MKIVSARVTPIAFREPPLLNTAGVHEPYALRSIIEVETDTGLVGLGESYGEATALAVLAAIASPLPGLDPFDLHGLRGVVAEIIAALPLAQPGAELAPGSHPLRQEAIGYSAFDPHARR